MEELCLDVLLSGRYTIEWMASDPCVIIRDVSGGNSHHLPFCIWVLMGDGSSANHIPS